MNNSGSEIALLLDDTDRGTITNAESQNVTILLNEPSDRIRAYDPEGNLIFDETLTWEELVASHFRIVIE